MKSEKEINAKKIIWKWRLIWFLRIVLFPLVLPIKLVIALFKFTYGYYEDD